jgi:hypothetical protein
MPTYAFLHAPARLTTHLHRKENAPLPRDRLAGHIHCFGTRFDARVLSMPGRSTSELLRTL